MAAPAYYEDALAGIRPTALEAGPGAHRRRVDTRTWCRSPPAMVPPVEADLK